MPYTDLEGEFVVMVTLFKANFEFLFRMPKSIQFRCDLIITELIVFSSFFDVTSFLDWH